MLEGMRQQWLDLLQRGKVDPVLAAERFGEIAGQYASSGRYYHTLDHILDVLATVDKLASHAPQPDAVRLAAWLHDVIYDSRASDNEERSAEYARRLCGELGIPDAALVASLILQTKTHIVDDDRNGQVLVDAELAILGASASVYHGYAQNIRREYAWVPESAYRTGRQRVLENFLIRPRIYHLLTDLEAPARKNLTAEIALLAAGDLDA